LLEMQPLEDVDLEGFEYFLSEIQTIINNFNESSATSNLAWDKGYPKKEDGFSGRVVCGRAEYVGQLKKDGNLMWHCPFKFPFKYYVLLDDKMEFLKSSYEKAELDKLRKEGKGFVVEEKQYSGCPAFSIDRPQDLL